MNRERYFFFKSNWNLGNCLPQLQSHLPNRQKHTADILTYVTFTIYFSLIVFPLKFSILRVTVTLLPPQISRFRSLYRLSSNNSEYTNHRHLPLTGTHHCNSGLLKIFTFRDTVTHFRTIIFSQSPRFQFSSHILDGFCVSFNAHHFFMRKQFMCIDYYTSRLTFSNIILHKRAIRWILVASQAEMRKDECVPEVVAYEWNLIVMNYWREILQFI